MHCSVFLLLLFFVSSVSSADDWKAEKNLHSEVYSFVNVYESALTHNLDYQVVKQLQRSQRFNRAISRSYLLPNVTLNYRHAHNWSEIEQDSGSVSESDSREYESYSASLRVQQTLFDYAAWQGFKKSDQQAHEAQSKLHLESMKLAKSVFQAYTHALLARDQLALAQHQHSYHLALLDRNLAMKAAGEETQTAVLETQSQLYRVETDLLMAEDDLDFSLRDFNHLTGLLVSQQGLPVLSSGPVYLPLAFQSVEEWQKIALVNNPEIGALNYKVQSLNHEVEEVRGGHFPRVNLFASTSLSDSNTENTYRQSYDTDTIGIQIQMPLYLGGRVSNGVGQVESEKDSVLYELKSLKQSVSMRVRRHFRQCQRSALELKARRHAVTSTTELLAATEKSIQGGLRSNHDVLQVRQQLFRVKLELAKSRYDYLNAWLGLHVEAAIFDHSHIEALSNLFTRLPKRT